MRSSENDPIGVLHPSKARDMARLRLEADFPRRWAHTQGVVVTLAYLLDYIAVNAKEETLLLNAGWLHDIGYGLPESKRTTGWHPLDGADYLTAEGIHLVAPLVAWHTTAPEEAAIRGLADHLNRYPEPTGRIADALTYADMTTGPDGYPCTFEQRLIEIRARHGATSTPVQAMENAWSRLMDVRQRIDLLIRRAAVV